MPSITSVINSLLRLLPGDAASAIHKSVLKLHPQGENLSDPQSTEDAFLRHLRAWHTRHAYESCRGWRWPYWLKAQTSVLSQSWRDLQSSAGIFNGSQRDALAIPGLPGKFAGTVDRRGMVTPRHGRFSLETWVRIGSEVYYPSSIFNEDLVSWQNSASGARVEIRLGEHLLSMQFATRTAGDTPALEVQTWVSPNAPHSKSPISIYFAIRPYDNESIIPLPDLVYNSSGFWATDSKIITWCPTKPANAWASDARHDDAGMFLDHPPERTAVRCAAGLATAIMEFSFPDRAKARATIFLPLEPVVARTFSPVDFLHLAKSGTETSSSPAPKSTDNQLTIDATQLDAMTDITHGPIRTQWHRQGYYLASAVLGLLSRNNTSQANRLLSFALMSQGKNGYLDLCAGHWCVAGQTLYAAELLNAANSDIASNYPSLRATARWIMRKRREISHSPGKPKGLLPPGVTRAGVGLEYNLIDNLWCLEGLCAAANLARVRQEHHDADVFRKDSEVYAARISAAIHRELEFGFHQIVPGRLMRAFDSTSAAELLDLTLMPNARRLLKSDDWFGRLIKHLARPLTNAPSESPFTLRNIDETGIRPGRRMLLCLALLQQDNLEAARVISELQELVTPMGTWTESLNLQTRSGCGEAFIDVEATAIHQVLDIWQKHGCLTNNPPD